MRIINHELKWYTSENYLELFLPERNVIEKIEYPNIDKFWNQVLQIYSTCEITDTIEEGNIEMSEFLHVLLQNRYILEVSNEKI